MRPPTAWRILSCLVSGFALAVATGLARTPDDFLVRNWSTVDGVPHNTVRALIQSRDGYLWMGTANGVARFDGVRFVVFNTVNTPGLPADDIFGLYEDRSGDLWLRTRQGVVRRHNGRFNLAPRQASGPTEGLFSFAEDADGQLWFLGIRGLARWDGEQIVSVPMPTGAPSALNHFCAAPDGGLWLTDRQGLWRFRDGRCELIPVSPPPDLIAAGRDGRVWGLHGSRGLFVLSNRQWSPVTALDGEPCETLYLAPNGDLWIGSRVRTVAFRVRDGTVNRVGFEQGLEGNRVIDFVRDSEGNVWLGANAGGLFRLRERRVRVYDRSDGLESLNTSSLVQLHDGALMVNVMGRTLHRFAGGRFEPMRLPDYSDPTALARAQAGGVWAGLFSGNLRRIVDGREVERLGSANGTRALFTDREGRLWRGLRTTGIERFEGTNQTRFSTNEGLSFPNVYCFAQDRDGAVWAGTEKGLNRIVNDRVTRFGAAEGLGHGFISALCVDSRGTLWAGTLGGGLSAWNGTRFVTLNTREGLPSDTIEQVIEDDLGNLWLGTRVGLVRASLQQLHDCLGGRARVLTTTLLARNEGLERPNFWTEYQPATLKTTDGRLWFCTGSGLVEIDPRRFAAAAPPPVVQIEELALDGTPIPKTDPQWSELTLGPNPQRLEIRFTGLSPSNPELVRFRHRLEGYDADWVEAGHARAASYSKLPPGRYMFEVKAANNDGVWSERPATLPLVVRPAYWQTSWFRAALLFLGLTAIYAAHRARVSRMERRRAEQDIFARRLIDSQEQERKRIAAELHDSLGQNLLVIKNRAALALTQQAQPEKMLAQFRQVADMASAAVREVRDIAQNLRPFQIDELGLTKAIRAMARSLGDASNLTITTDLDDVDRSLPVEFEISLYRTVQESLNNVVKHAQAKSAHVTLRRSADTLHLSVSDDGRGFSPAQAASPPAPGFGLKNIVERVRGMGGVCKIDSQPEAGTRIEIRIPITSRDHKSELS